MNPFSIHDINFFCWMLLLIPIDESVFIVIFESSSPSKLLFSLLDWNFTKKMDELLHIDEMKPFTDFNECPGFYWFGNQHWKGLVIHWIKLLNGWKNFKFFFLNFNWLLTLYFAFINSKILKIEHKNSRTLSYLVKSSLTCVLMSFSLK